MLSIEPITSGIFIIIGSFFGALSLHSYQKYKLKSFQQIANNILQKAESDAKKINEAADFNIKEKESHQQKELEKKWHSERKKLSKHEERLKEREDKLDSRMSLVEKKLTETERRESTLLSKIKLNEENTKTLQENKQKLIEELESISGLSASEAKEILLNKITNEVKADAANFIRKTTKEAEEDAERTAQKIIIDSITRLAVPCVSEATINTVTLPHEDMKGRIIGREGRNIRALERATGINFIIDDTPNAVVLSGFDPLRLHIAKLTLTELVSDGRIHPTKIEEVVEKAKLKTQREIKFFGEDTALRAGIMDLHPEIIQLLGKLKFRHSFGQNILEHSLEVSYIMGLMAGELGLDSHLAKRIGLLHDMGKAVSHEMEGTHAIIGHDLALKYGETKEVANGIGCHHFEMEAMTIEGSLCSSADAISASRPGARIEAVEEYIKRLKNLEKIAYDFPGIERAHALQAGRELRIFVKPDVIDDDGVITLARDLSKRIEKELCYPGKVKVSVTREKQVVDYAM
ncbi:MAG: ribonuclease Y [Chlamydiota bacterium]|nr:ribonuclease Y [Chlamydiota bacterium]